MAVPQGRVNRLARFGGLASGVAGAVLVQAAREAARGRRPLWPAPPLETVLLQRKFAGVHLLARRLGARVDVNALLAPYVQ